jgi:diaminohydroxyphosphoribosylaminopyrimidine deaminase/5-amino-6-(5-phosphoribosylamino)uracil reductase
LGKSTVYVSLEPCSHYGKTPPCADLIISKGVKRVVCGCVDPFAKVRGRGIQKLRDAGIEVTVGVLRDECLRLNSKFIANNTLRRPYVMLKWAQTANKRLNRCDGHPLRISTAWTQSLVHKLRSEFDCILVGYNTIITDHPQLNVRLWVGPDPQRLVLSGNHPIPEGFMGFGSIDEVMQWMTDHQKQSLLVEGGATTLNNFIDDDCWDAIRVETGTMSVPCGTRAPMLPVDAHLVSREMIDGNIIENYERK